jgi:predicted transcriptional regulator
MNETVADLRRLKSDLIIAGISQTSVARDLGVHPSMVSKVLGGKKTSRRVLQRIKDLLSDESKAA